jgi:hypothetical protein
VRFERSIILPLPLGEAVVADLVDVRRAKMNRILALLLALSLFGSIVGCSDNGLGLVPVSGKVTFAGQPPPKGGTITFNPITVQEGLPRRPGTAQFAQDGTFTVTSFKKGDGLVPGTYHPRVACWKAPPDSNDPSSFDRLNYVPKDFQPDPIVVAADADEVDVIIDVPRLN